MLIPRKTLHEIIKEVIVSTEKSQCLVSTSTGLMKASRNRSAFFSLLYITCHEKNC